MKGLGLEFVVTRGHWGHTELQFWANVRYAEHDESLPFNRYLVNTYNTYNKPDPGDTSVNKASRLLEPCMIWPLATSPWSSSLSPLAHYSSAILAFLSILESLNH